MENVLESARTATKSTLEELVSSEDITRFEGWDSLEGDNDLEEIKGGGIYPSA